MCLSKEPGFSESSQKSVHHLRALQSSVFIYIYIFLTCKKIMLFSCWNFSFRYFNINIMTVLYTAHFISVKTFFQSRYIVCTHASPFLLIPHTHIQCVSWWRKLKTCLSVFLMLQYAFLCNFTQSTNC